MNQEIEQRIVAMYFDNKDFEKNAKQTIETIGELRDNLNLEDSVKGFEELDKAGKKLNLNNVKSNINNMKNSLSGFQNVLNKAFSIGTGPVRALENFFGTFQSYVGKFVGFDLASKFVNSLENALRQLTVAPIEAGWSMYESTIDSVKTIMSGTMESYKKTMSATTADWTYDETKHMDFVKGQLNELSRYAQKTVFSLSDMTSNVGKFTNNNVDLETAVTAMEGIANMTAKAGQGAQQASMAMYNFSQAIGVGKMTTIDWKSIENANIATTEMKNLMMEAAAATGTLQKKVEKVDGKEVVKFYRTVDKEGRALAQKKWEEVSVEKFRDSLQSGWLDKDTMLAAMKIYSGEITDIDTLEAMGFKVKDNPELAEMLIEVGRSASEAASQVRTFSKMWDALTESVQSGWSDSMQLIFGDMFEATEFWTRINDELGGILDKSANERNKMLHEWRGEVYNSEKEIWEKQEGAYDGRKDLLQGIYNMIAAAKALGGAFSNAWHEVFGKMDGSKLQDITRKFRELTEQFNQWLDVRGADGEARIEKIQKGLRGVFSILKAVGNAVKSVFGVILKLAAPVTDVFINLFSGVVGFFDGIGDMNFKEIVDKVGEGIRLLWAEITRFFSPTETKKYIGSRLETVKGDSPFMQLLKSTFGSAGKVIKEWMSDNGLGGVLQALEDAWAWIVEVWNKISSWEGWAAIGAFFTNIFVAIKEYLTPKNKAYDDRGFKLNQDSQFIRDVKNVWRKIKETWDKVAGWSGWASIGQFFSGIGGWLAKYYNITVDFFSTPNTSGKTGFVEWLESVGAWFSKIWMPIANWDQWEKIGLFFSNIWVWLTGKAQEALSWFQISEDGSASPFVQFLNSIAAEVSRIWGIIANWTGWEEIKGFFVNTWNWITGVAEETLGWFRMGEDGSDSPFVKLLNSIAAEVSRIWGVVANWTGWDAIKGFFIDTWKWITGQAETALGWFKMGEDGSDSPFVKFLNSIAAEISRIWSIVSTWSGWDEIKNFFVNTWNWITGVAKEGLEWFQMGEDGSDSPFIKFLKSIAAELSKIWSVISGWSGWKEIASFFTDTWNWILGLFTDEGDAGQDVKKGKKSKSALSKLKDKVEVAKKDATETNKELTFFERILSAISGFVTNITTALTGQDMEKVTKFFEAMGTFFNGLLDIITKALDSIGKFLSATAEGGIGAGYASLSGDTKATLWIGGAIALIGYIVDIVKTRWSSKIALGESVAHKLFELGAAMLMVSVALGVIALIPIEKILTGGVVLAAVLLIMSKIAASLAQSAQYTHTQVWYERVLNNLIGAIEKIAIVAIVMKLLPDVIKAFGEAKQMAPELSGMDILGTLVGIGTFIAEVCLALGVVAKITGNVGIDPIMAGKSALAIIVFLGLLMAALGVIGAELGKHGTVDKLITSINDAKRILEALGSALGGFLGTLVVSVIDPVKQLFQGQSDSEKMDESMKILESLGSKLDYFSSDKLYGINRILSSVGMLAQTVQGVPDAGKIRDFVGGLEPMGEAIMRLGITLAGFVEHDSEIDGLSLADVEGNIYKVAEIMRAFNIPDMEWDSLWSSGTASKFLDNIRWLNKNMNASDFEAFGNLSKQFVEAFDKATAPNGDAMVRSAGDLLQNLSTAIRLGMGNTTLVGPFDATPIVDSIVIALGHGESAIAVAVHNMVQSGINALGGTNAGEGLELEVPEFLKSGETGDLISQIFGGNILGNMGNILYGEGGTKENPAKDSLYGMINGFSFDLNNIQMPNWSEEIQSLKETMTFTDEEGNEIDLQTMIQNQLNEMNASLQEANASFEITIIPTIDWKNLTADSIRNQLGDMPIDYPINLSMPDKPIQIDYTGLFNEIRMDFIQDQLTDIESAIDADRVAVVEAVNNMGTRIDNVSTSIRALKLYLDTGALVGGITPYVDLALGRRARLAERLGVSIP